MDYSAKLSQWYWLLMLCCASLVTTQARNFEIFNNCSYTVWAAAYPGGGQRLGQGQTWNLSVAEDTTNGRIWGRTGCNFNGSRCQTGDCSGGLHCTGNGDPPTTLAEYALNQGNNLDFYDISLVDGFNIPMEFYPLSNGSCHKINCTYDINGQCPKELRAQGGCNNPCTVFKTNEYCCTNTSQGSCGPTNYSKFFKDRCPDAYSYPQDDSTSTFTCPAGSNYKVVFCGPLTVALAEAPTIRGPVAEAPTIRGPVAVAPTIRGPVVVAPPTRSKSTNRWWIWLIISVGITLAIPVIYYLCRALWRKYKAKVQKKMMQKNLLHEIGGNSMLSKVYGKARRSKKKNKISSEVELFSFETLAAATSNFSDANKLGEGGFGPVYKGTLSDGQEVAIKRLSESSGQGLIEFKNEAKLMAKLQHTNLVKLLGFCIQRDERILVYEYMPNKSLDFYLFDSTRKNLLDWNKRLNIIGGVAQGLLYLHKYSRLKVIHRDLKAGNVLLDEEMNPKISDFGMARIFGLRGPEENTNRVVGTYGYMAPEYAINGVVSIKTDVFSFGVLLLEILCGKKNNSRYHSDGPLNLIGHAWLLWNEGRALELVDQALNESITQNEVLRCIHISLLCVSEQATNRPTMLDIVSFLSNDTIQLPQPKKPAFFINVDETEQQNSRQENQSLNEATISIMHAR